MIIMAEEEKIELPPEDSQVEISLSDDKEDSNNERKGAEPDEREVALSELKQQLDAARKQAAMAQQAKQQAEQYARKQAEVAYSAQSEASENQYRVIINAINASEQAASNAERAYADAMASGDYAAAAKVQRDMARIESQLTQFNSAKAELEEKAQYQQTEGRVPDPAPQYEAQPQEYLDPVEAAARTLSPKSADWIRSHPDMINHIPKLRAAHQYAVDVKGIVSESPEYFNFLENEMGVSKGNQPKKAVASTPVTSSASYSSSRGGNDTMVLSAAEVEQAMLNEPELPKQKALEIYARNKKALIKEGRM